MTTLRLRTFLQALRDRAGAASVEFALIAGTLASISLNGVEIGRYYYIRMEVQNAAQMATQAVWKVCDQSNEVPVTTKCTARTTAISTAIASTTLGSEVTLASGFPTEAYYCVSTTTGALTNVGAVTAARPANCSAAGNAAETPGNHVVIKAQYTYVPIFRGITIGSLLNTDVNSTATMRIR